jgi:hypothetical protein
MPVALDGNDHVAFSTYQLQQASTMYPWVKTAPLGRDYIGIGLCSIWKMMIWYPFGATCFMKAQCNKIQARYLPTFLSKMVINCMNQRQSGMDFFHTSVAW